MSTEEGVSEWGSRWLAAWVAAPTATDDERATRAWQAEHWKAATLETVFRWWRDAREFERFGAELGGPARRANDDLKLYLGTRHGLPVWRAYFELRSAGLPVPENILAKFDQWAARLIELERDAALQKQRRDEGDTILRALELAGDQRSHKSLGRLRELERRRALASKIAQLRDLGLTWAGTAERMKMEVQAAKDVLYEFKPGPRRARASRGTGEGLADAYRRMIRK